MSNDNFIRIDEEDVAFIMGKCYRYFQAIINGAYCNTCKTAHHSRITNYVIYLDACNDIIIDGSCDKCASSVHRCIETGEKIGPGERAAITWMVKVDLLGQRAA